MLTLCEDCGRKFDTHDALLAHDCDGGEWLSEHVYPEPEVFSQLAAELTFFGVPVDAAMRARFERAAFLFSDAYLYPAAS